MAFNFLTKIFGSRNDRLLKQYRKTVERINALESSLESLSDDELRGKTDLFRQQLAQGATLDELLPEAFAVVREGSKRVMRMRHFDVQLMGGMALHQGKIAEMRTGEGKTLTATLPVYLNALSGNGVHVVTVNDYLAQRDAQWMGRLYNFLGLSVGINLPQMSREDKQAAYRSDITYGTNNEYGFDYLRDNMVYEPADRVQRALSYAIVDEVDSILIDEARTPLIISGQAEDHTAMYKAINLVVPNLTRQIGEADPRTGEGVITPGDFTVDEKSNQVFLTEQGHETAERLLSSQGLLPEGASLYDPSHISLMHHLYAALRAHNIYHRDQHYVVQNGEIIIVDEFTGRLMSGRRWSDGLHQAVEAKEGVQIQAENQTMASITFQNYFRLYGKLSGMTGTADTEAYEFQEIYGLETVIIPPTVQAAATTNSTASTRPPRKNTTQRLRIFVSVTSAGSRCWWAPLPSKTLSSLRSCSPRPSYRTRCSTPSSTREKPISWLRPVRPSPSPSPPTWQVEAPTSCSGAMSKKPWPPSRSMKAWMRPRVRRALPHYESSGKKTTSLWCPKVVCASLPPSAMSRAVSTTSCVAARVVRATRVHRASS